MSKQLRQKSALGRLKQQLKSGVKPFENKAIPLTENDVKRINHEINVLETRLKKVL